MEIVVRPAMESDLPTWVSMRMALWPDSKESELAQEAREWLSPNQPHTLVLVAITPAHGVCGFAEASLRNEYVNGCDTSPVAFLEGIYVAPVARRAGVGQQLVSEVKRWAIQSGCSELASDSYLDNQSSLDFHQAIGFVETERTVFFRQVLKPD